MSKDNLYHLYTRPLLAPVFVLLAACGGAPDIKELLGSGPDDPFDLVAEFNSGETHTTSASVTLNIDATNSPFEMLVTTDSKCETGTWETFANSKAITLSNLNTETEMFVKVRDELQEKESFCVSASIIHDSIAPTLTISAPLATTFANIANVSGFPVGGTCSENGRVQITGSATGTATCSNGSWNTTVNLTSAAQGSVNLSATLTDLVELVSPTQTVNFTKDTVAPTSPTVSIDSDAAATASLNSTLTLSATDATEMYVTNTAGCASGGTWESYATSKSWTLATANAINTVYVKYRDPAGNETTCANDSITHSNTPPALTFTTPANGTWVNLDNQNAFSVGGSCGANGQSIVISGDVSQTVTCTSGLWSAAFNLSAGPDGTDVIEINVDHSSETGVAATQIQRIFSKDTVLPSALAITSPVNWPYQSPDNSVAVSGTCEANAAIALSGAETETANCTAGSFALTLNQTADGTYNYTATQTDAAGNTSANHDFTWIRSATTPAPPTITTPASTPIYTNASSQTVSGTCVTGNTVTLGGDVVAADVLNPIGSLTQTCSDGAFSFVVEKLIDGAYTLQVTQKNASDLTSSPSQIVWNRDTVAPTNLTISNPMTSPYTSGGELTLAGACEADATVNLSGDDTQNLICASSDYSFTINKGTDGTYNFTVSQTDLAGNTSSTLSQQWVRDSSTLPAPVITTPASTPISNNSVSLTLSGTCVTGYTVTLDSGALASEVTTPSNSLTQTCVGGAFSYVIAKSTDGTYDFAVSQTDGFTVSLAVNQQWVRDTTPPNTTFSQTPLNPNPRFIANFDFTADEAGSTFECSLDSGAWSVCTTPVSITSLSNATHTYEVRAVDAVGNIDPTPISYTWVQEAFNAIALYKFDSGSELVDSSLYTSTLNNPLTNVGSASTTTSKFGQARQLTASSSHRLYAADSNSFDATESTMTVEMWVRHSSLPANNQYMVYTSKSSTTAGNIGWEFGVKKAGGGSSNYRLYFSSSIDGGATRVERVSGSNCADLATTSTYTHVAVTWDKGSINFYCNGAANGSNSNGTIGSAVLYQSTGQFQIGTPVYTSGGVHNYFNGYIDEVRISQIVRWTTTFTPQTATYTAD